MSMLEVNRANHTIVPLPLTGRDQQFYKDVFSSQKETADVARKRTVLDVGARDSNYISSLNHSGANVLGLALDPSYFTHPPVDLERKIAGIAQALPFKDEVFDEITASFSLSSVHIPFTELMLELVRVTRVGGQISIYPAHFYPSDYPHPAHFRFLDTRINDSLNLWKTLRVTKIAGITPEQWEKDLRELSLDIFI